MNIDFNPDLTHFSEMKFHEEESQELDKKVDGFSSIIFQNGMDQLNSGNFVEAYKLFDRLTIDNDRATQITQISLEILKQNDIAWQNDVVWDTIPPFLIRKRMFAQALMFYNGAIEANPHHIFLRIQRGLFYLKINQFVQAEREFKEAMAMSSREKTGWDKAKEGLARCYYEQKTYDDALREINEIHEPGLSVKTLQMRIYYEQGRKEEVFKQIAHLFREYPNAGSLYELKGDLLRREGDLWEALECFNRLIEITPKHAYGLASRAALNLMLNKNIVQSQIDLDLAFKLDPFPKDFFIWMARAQLNYRHYKLKEALSDLDHILKIDPKNESALLMKNHFKNQPPLENYPSMHSPLAISYIHDRCFKLRANERLLQITFQLLRDKPGQPELLAVRAWAFLQKGNVKQAKEVNLKALECNPSDSLALETKRDLLWIDGKHAEALEDLNKFIETNPKNPSGWYERGMFYLKKQMIEHALNNFRKAHQLDKGNSAFLGALGEALRLSGDFENAILYLNKAIECDEKNYSALTSLADIYWRKGDIPLAWDKIHAAISCSNENYYPAYFLRGELYLAANQIEEAHNDFKRILDLFPDDIPTLKKAALCDYYLGKLIDPLEQMQKILEKTPNDLFIKSVCAHILCRQGNKMEALKYLENPTSSFALACYGAIIKNSDVQKAIEYFKKAIELNPLESLAVMNYGVILMNQKKLEEAHKYFDTLTRAGHHSSAWKYKIQILSKQGKLPAFLIELKKTTNIKDCNQLWRLGEVEFLLKNNSAAIKTFQDVLKSDPKHMDAAISLYFNLNEVPPLPHPKHPTMTAHMALETINKYHPVTKAAYGLGLPKDQALKHIQEALLLDSLNPDILRMLANVKKLSEP